jgi:TRAP-type transport system periplasmic protein
MRSRYSILSAITIAAAIMTTTLASTVGALPATMVIKLSAPTLNDANHEWMKRFAVLIEKNSDGRMKAEIYPASQLGSIPRQIEGAQLGSIQIVLTAAEFLVGVDPRFELLAAPGIFQNDNHVIKTITDPEFANAFLAMGASKGLLGAGLLFNGPAAFAMRAPARTLADFKGKKIRVLASPFQTEQIARLGGTGDFLLDQRKAWIGKGGELIALSPADKAELMARYRTIGDDIVKSKPQLKPIWDLLVATALRSL